MINFTKNSYYGLDSQQHRLFVTVSSVMGYVVVLFCLLYAVKVTSFYVTFPVIIAVGRAKLVYESLYLRKHGQLKNLRKSMMIRIAILLLIIVLSFVILFLRYR